MNTVNSNMNENMNNAAPNVYHCFHKGKKLELTAPTSFDAQKQAALLWGIGRRNWDVAVVLVGKVDADGNEQTITHNGAEL